MITLKDTSNNRWLGQISYEHLKFLNDELDAEYKSGEEYWINRDCLDTLIARGADPQLIAVLEKAMGNQGGIQFYWIK